MNTRVATVAAWLLLGSLAACQSFRPDTSTARGAAQARLAREDAFVIELIHTPDAASETTIQEIITEYRTRFRQGAVMRVSDRIEVSF